MLLHIILKLKYLSHPKVIFITNIFYYSLLKISFILSIGQFLSISIPDIVFEKSSSKKGTFVLLEDRAVTNAFLCPDEAHRLLRAISGVTIKLTVNVWRKK